MKKLTSEFFFRSLARICQVCLYILLWVLLQQNTEYKVNSQISEQFTVSESKNSLFSKSD